MADAVTRNQAEVSWVNPPGHTAGALSKMLVRPETTGSERIDFRVSTYQPGAEVEAHSHRVQEQVFHVTEGEGLMTLDGVSRVMRPGDTAFIPAGVVHRFQNTGLRDLTFFVVTSPPNDA